MAANRSQMPSSILIEGTEHFTKISRNHGIQQIYFYTWHLHSSNPAASHNLLLRFGKGRCSDVHSVSKSHQPKPYLKGLKTST